MAKYCPECSEPLTPPGEKCICGWKQDKSAAAHGVPYPTIEDLTDQLAATLLAWKNPRPYWLNTVEPRKAAEKWLSVLEPHRKRDAPERTAKGWRWPYADRVEYCLQRYLRLSFEDQKTVIAAREDKIFWRGDDIQLFATIIHETLRMREVGRDEYMREVRQRIRSIQTKITSNRRAA